MLKHHFQTVVRVVFGILTLIPLSMVAFSIYKGDIKTAQLFGALPLIGILVLLMHEQERRAMKEDKEGFKRG
ncbi:hypothetical protein IMZ31_22400 (plasmid) [Pontibacillus sp. ALD_SL1]|uniref:hypothetical protein n=1 Tax=Pontibacillus sp. ALD_SL1 TaxID=2777185 RepID=UPI001A97843B|nr:hypothetical protein [Pontibacillus sp. ALD_SL1]QST02207.1 hypothetical protein IMZ31_22400 [Pontibacillus sp. ALD_SL1]